MTDSDRYDLLVNFSMQLDTWGMVVAPDDYDERSHDVLVTEYRDRARRLPRGPEFQRVADEIDLLADYANWLDQKAVLSNAGPYHKGLEGIAERFLNDHSNGRIPNHA